MELTLQNLEHRLELLKEISCGENQDKQIQLKQKLKEKGVECSIIYPIIEVIMGFDAFNDILFEAKSQIMRNQRFDFVLCNDFIIEVKQLFENLEGHEEQIRDYIRENDNIHYGIITNGIDYEVWIQKSFIQSVLYEDTKNNDEKRKLLDRLPHKNKKVIKVFEFSISDLEIEDFKKMLELFHRNNYRKTFYNISRYIYRIIFRKRGQHPTINNKKDIDEIIKEQIKENIVQKTGYYYDKLKGGTKLVYQGGGIKIVVSVLENGYISIIPRECNIYDYQLAINNKYENFTDLLKQWSRGERCEYASPIDIIKDIKNVQRVFSKDKIIESFKKM